VRAPTPSELLTAWERGAKPTPAERGVELLALASPGTQPDELAALPVGERDRRLLDLRAALFGRELDGLDTCPECEEPVSFSVRVEALRAEPAQAAAAGLSLDADGFELRFRLPTGADLAAISREHDSSVARARLLELCVLGATRNGADVTVESLPVAVTEALASSMAEADPQGDVELALDCPACGHSWRVCFDVASFLWAEVDAWSRRTLDDVHVLASAYGWSEDEILALGPRRQHYLERVGA
jgi:hypothetical protein